MQEQLEKALRNIDVCCHTKLIEPKLDFENLPPKRGQETDLHRALKKLGYNLLKEKGEPHPLYEHYNYDVYSPTLRVRVECGVTPFYRILNNFTLPRHSWVRELWLIEYPSVDGITELIIYTRA